MQNTNLGGDHSRRRDLLDPNVRVLFKNGIWYVPDRDIVKENIVEENGMIGTNYNGSIKVKTPYLIHSHSFVTPIVKFTEVPNNAGLIKLLPQIYEDGAYKTIFDHNIVCSNIYDNVLNTGTWIYPVWLQSARNQTYTNFKDKTCWILINRGTRGRSRISEIQIIQYNNIGIENPIQLLK